MFDHLDPFSARWPLGRFSQTLLPWGTPSVIFCPHSPTLISGLAFLYPLQCLAFLCFNKGQWLFLLYLHLNTKVLITLFSAWVCAIFLSLFFSCMSPTLLRNSSQLTPKCSSVHSLDGLWYPASPGSQEGHFLSSNCTHIPRQAVAWTPPLNMLLKCFSVRPLTHGLSSSSFSPGLPFWVCVGGPLSSVSIPFSIWATRENIGSLVPPREKSFEVDLGVSEHR